MSIRKNVFLSVATLALAFTMAGTANAQTGSWSAPPVPPPTGNVPAPINTGSAVQTKAGRLFVGSLGNTGPTILVGHVDIGPCPITCSAFASADPERMYTDGTSVKTAFKSLGNSFAALFSAPMAQALGTGGLGGIPPPDDIGPPSGYTPPPMGKLDVWGDIRQNGELVCLQSGTNCPTSTGQWTTAGANIYRNSGLVGVGLTAPTAPLHVEGTSNRNSAVMIVSSTGTANGDNSATTEKGLTVAAAGSAGQGLLFNVKRGTTNLFAVGGNGNVGINTNNPGAPLTVNGDTVIGGAATGNKTISFSASNNASIELGSNGYTTPAGTTPFVDFHYGGSNQDYNARVINDADGQLSFQTNGGGTKMKVVNTSQSVVVTNSPAVYLITSGACNAAGPTASDSSMVFLSAGTLQRGTLSTYKYCKVSGSFVEQQLVGYLLPPPPEDTGGTPPGGTSYGPGTVSVAFTGLASGWAGRITTITMTYSSPLGISFRRYGPSATVSVASDESGSGTPHSYPAGTGTATLFSGSALACGTMHYIKVGTGLSGGPYATPGSGVSISGIPNVLQFFVPPC